MVGLINVFFHLQSQKFFGCFQDTLTKNMTLYTMSKLPFFLLPAKTNGVGKKKTRVIFSKKTWNLLEAKRMHQQKKVLPFPPPPPPPPIIIDNDMLETGQRRYQ